LKLARITVAGLGGRGPLGALGIDETQLKQVAASSAAT